MTRNGDTRNCDFQPLQFFWLALESRLQEGVGSGSSHLYNFRICLTSMTLNLFRWPRISSGSDREIIVGLPLTEK